MDENFSVHCMYTVFLVGKYHFNVSSYLCRNWNRILTSLIKCDLCSSLMLWQICSRTRLKIWIMLHIIVVFLSFAYYSIPRLCCNKQHRKISSQKLFHSGPVNSQRYLGIGYHHTYINEMHHNLKCAFDSFSLFFKLSAICFLFGQQ